MSAAALKLSACLGWALGAWLIYTGMAMDVTVDTGGGTVANFQLMHVQQLDMVLGALAIIDGTICMIGGLILEQMRYAATPPQQNN